MRFWIKFNKEDPLRFLSHLDLMRAWQRTLRRAALPVAYSAGFSPKQRLSFASALQVGATSEAEYLDLLLTRRVTDADFTRLQETLPQGIKILAYREVPPAIPSLMVLVGAAGWELMLSGSQNGLKEKIEHLLAAETLMVVRESKKGMKTVELRPLILLLTLKKEISGDKLEMLLQMGGEAGARPGEILKALQVEEDESKFKRTDLFIRLADHLQSPMEVLLKGDEVEIDAKKDYYQL